MSVVATRTFDELLDEIDQMVALARPAEVDLSKTGALVVEFISEMSDSDLGTTEKLDAIVAAVPMLADWSLIPDRVFETFGGRANFALSYLLYHLSGAAAPEWWDESGWATSRTGGFAFHLPVGGDRPVELLASTYGRSLALLLVEDWPWWARAMRATTPHKFIRKDAYSIELGFTWNELREAHAHCEHEPEAGPILDRIQEARRAGGAA